MSILTSGGKVIQVGGKGLNYLPPWLSIGKGDIIKMNLDGSDREYRVLKREGSVVEVLTMWNVSTSTSFNIENTSTYAGKTLDTYLNTTWYNTLSSETKNAIAPKNINQYQYNAGSYNETTHSSSANYSTKVLNANVGERYVYALDVEDIEMYFGGTGGSVDDKTQGTFSKTDLLQMFWNQTSTISEYPWLRSAVIGNSSLAWHLFGSTGSLSYNSASGTNAVRAAFQIDLSKVSFTPPPIVNKGELITMNLDGTDRLYRVLKCEGNVAEVLSMEEVGTSVFGDNNTYSGSTLDTYLNSTWYNTLSTKAKNAIIAKNIIQYEYISNSSAGSSTHASYADYSTKMVKENVGKRNVYALDVEDIEMYFGGTGGSADNKTPGTFSVSSMFELFNQEATFNNIWLRSGIELLTTVWIIRGFIDSQIVGSSLSTSNSIYPAFTINLSKIPFTKSV